MILPYSTLRKRYEAYMLLERGLSDNTREAYLRDLDTLQGYLRERGIDFDRAELCHLEDYLAELHDTGIAPRSIASELKAENIIATADVNELSSLDTISIKLSTNIANQREITLIPSHDIIRLKIENKRSKALALKASVTGSVEDGYMIGDISTDQNLVRISGPESAIDHGGARFQDSRIRQSDRSVYQQRLLYQEHILQ